MGITVGDGISVEATPLDREATAGVALGGGRTAAEGGCVGAETAVAAGAQATSSRASRPRVAVKRGFIHILFRKYSAGNPYERICPTGSSSL